MLLPVDDARGRGVAGVHRPLRNSADRSAPRGRCAGRRARRTVRDRRALKNVYDTLFYALFRDVRLGSATGGAERSVGRAPNGRFAHAGGKHTDDLMTVPTPEIQRLVRQPRLRVVATLRPRFASSTTFGYGASGPTCSCCRLEASELEHFDLLLAGDDS